MVLQLIKYICFPFKIPDLAEDYTTKHTSSESKIVKILHQNHVSKMSPQMLILHQSSPKKCRLLGHRLDYQK